MIDCPLCKMFVGGICEEHLKELRSDNDLDLLNQRLSKAEADCRIRAQWILATVEGELDPEDVQDDDGYIAAQEWVVSMPSD